MKVIAGISIYLTTDIKQADRWIKQLHRCANCVQFTPLDLFGGVCAGYEAFYYYINEIPIAEFHEQKKGLFGFKAKEIIQKDFFNQLANN